MPPFAGLFDPLRTDEPHPALMPHFIDVFFTTYASRFPFVTYEAVVAGYLQSTLPPELAVPIAGLSAPLAGSIDVLNGQDLNLVGHTYLQKAKMLLTSGGASTCPDTLAGLLIVCHADIAAGRKQQCLGLMQRAVQMAAQMGLSSEETARRAASTSEQKALLLGLREGIAQLAAEFRASR